MNWDEKVTESVERQVSHKISDMLDILRITKEHSKTATYVVRSAAEAKEDIS